MRIPRRLTGTVGVLAAVGALAAATPSVYRSIVNNGGGASPGTANLWMSATAGGSCTRSSSGIAFNQSTSCNTLQAAYTASQSSDIVGVQANGAYGTQNVTGSKTAPFPVFDLTRSGSAASLTPNFMSGASCLASCVNGIEFDNGNFSPGWNLTNTTNGQPTNITFKNISSTGEEFFKGGSHISVIGGSDHNWSTSCNPAAMHIEGQIGTGTGNITIDHFLAQGVSFHDITNPLCAGSTNHFELVRIDENASFITVQGNNFFNAEQSSSTIFITSTSSTCTSAQCPHDIAIIDNFNGPTDGCGSCSSLFINGNVQDAICVNYNIAYNTFAAGGSLIADTNLCGTTKTNLTITGNLGPRGTSCATGWTYSSNVWQWSTNSPCNGSDKVVIGTNFAVDQLGLVNVSTGDLHLTSGSPAKVSGGTACFGVADFDGQTINSGTCNAGADQ